MELADHFKRTKKQTHKTLLVQNKEKTREAKLKELQQWKCGSIH